MENGLPHIAVGKPPKTVFFAAAFVLFCMALSTADSIGFVPDYIDGTAPIADSTQASDRGSVALSALGQLGDDDLMLDSEGHLLPPRGNVASAETAQTELPTRLSISAIGLDLPIQNPATKDVDELDSLLSKGPARYVDSAKLGEAGNMIIFAHSSHLPIVHNQMYKAFNRIPELTPGDVITLTGEDGKKYLYSVSSVTKKDVNDNVTISLGKDSTKLTLVTCDTLTGKSARFVLEADFIGIAQ